VHVYIEYICFMFASSCKRLNGVLKLYCRLRRWVKLESGKTSTCH